MGVQFAHIPGFSSVDLNGVWRLYKKKYPNVAEHPLLAPQFETFGGTNLHPNFQFQVGPGPVGARLWFLSQEENHLLQFQPDRFIANWRKGGNLRPYPHFEAISAAFTRDFKALQRHTERNFSFAVDVNQAEVSYINLVPVSEFADAGKWFSIFNTGEINIEASTVSFNEVVRDESGSPYARLYHLIQAAFAHDGKQNVFSLSLTFRGKPQGNDQNSLMRFFKAGRKEIVSRFGQITTKYAHEYWKRTP